MAVAGNRAARVAVDYSQYWVRSGPDIDGGGDSVPGLLVDLGPQAVAVLTGLHDGRATVTAQAAQEPPSGLDPAGMWPRRPTWNALTGSSWSATGAARIMVSWGRWPPVGLAATGCAFMPATGGRSARGSPP